MKRKINPIVNNNQLNEYKSKYTMLVRKFDRCQLNLEKLKVDKNIIESDLEEYWKNVANCKTTDELKELIFSYSEDEFDELQNLECHYNALIELISNEKNIIKQTNYYIHEYERLINNYERGIR